MATFTAAFTNHPDDGTNEQHRVPYLVLHDGSSKSAVFRPLSPDATVSTFTTTDAATTTYVSGCITGMAAEGITITQTS